MNIIRINRNHESLSISSSRQWLYCEKGKDFYGSQVVCIVSSISSYIKRNLKTSKIIFMPYFSESSLTSDFEIIQVCVCTAKYQCSLKEAVNTMYTHTSTLINYKEIGKSFQHRPIHVLYCVRQSCCPKTWYQYSSNRNCNYMLMFARKKVKRRALALLRAQNNDKMTDCKESLSPMINEEIHRHFSTFWWLYYFELELPALVL